MVLVRLLFVIVSMMLFMVISVVEIMVSVVGGSCLLKIMLISWFVICEGLNSVLMVIVVVFRFKVFSIGIMWMRSDDSVKLDSVKVSEMMIIVFCCFLGVSMFMMGGCGVLLEISVVCCVWLLVSVKWMGR